MSQGRTGEGVNKENELWAWAWIPKESCTIRWNLWHFVQDKHKFKKKNFAQFNRILDISNMYMH